jgi:hypothetical protein
MEVGKADGAPAFEIQALFERGQGVLDNAGLWVRPRLEAAPPQLEQQSRLPIASFGKPV